MNQRGNSTTSPASTSGLSNLPGCSWDDDITIAKAAVPPCCAAVVMPTLLRPTLVRAVDSLYAQYISEPCQLLLGVDVPLGETSVLTQVLAHKPPHWHVTILNPGYSTSVRHGGVHASRDGGALRTILSYLANSRYVAYLDDDNWWAPSHLPSLLEAIKDHDWAYSLRWFVERDSASPLAVDSWESVGPGRGIFRERFGGFADPNTLMIDKITCESVLRWWSVPLAGDPSQLTGDRNVFNVLSKQYRCRGTNQPTSYYVMDPRDGLHPQRMKTIESLRADAAGGKGEQVLPSA